MAAASFKRGSVFLEEPEDAPKVKTDTCTCLKDNLLLILTIVGIILGFIIGFAIRQLEPSEDAIMWLGESCENWLQKTLNTVESADHLQILPRRPSSENLEFIRGFKVRFF
jgi:hypothetical protein